MTSFRKKRDAIGWSIQNTADRLSVNERTVRRWDSGEFEAPAPIIAWLAKIAAYIDRNPPPGRRVSDT